MHHFQSRLRTPETGPYLALTPYGTICSYVLWASLWVNVTNCFSRGWVRCKELRTRWSGVRVPPGAPDSRGVLSGHLRGPSIHNPRYIIDQRALPGLWGPQARFTRQACGLLFYQLLTPTIRTTADDIPTGTSCRRGRHGLCRCNTRRWVRERFRFRCRPP